MRKLGIAVDQFKFIMPNAAPAAEGTYCIDTANLFSALEGHKQSKSLDRMCRILRLPNTERFHNAGNDAQVRSSTSQARTSAELLDITLAVHSRCFRIDGIGPTCRRAEGRTLAPKPQ